MNTIAAKNGAYWHRACHFFSSSGYSHSEGSYLVHDKEAGKVHIGLACATRIAVGGGVLSVTREGATRKIRLHPDSHIFKRIDECLDRNSPTFFLISPDIYRRDTDSRIPQVSVVQPVIELTFSDMHAAGYISYTRDASAKQQALQLLRKSEECPLASLDDIAQDLPLPPFAELAARWTPQEKDDVFLRKLEDAIDRLTHFPEGKMTLTRSYLHEVPVTHDPFELYKLHANRNGDYACSHFFCLRSGCFSLGCSPENVFAMHGTRLLVDVVAGTCAASNSLENVKEELIGNPKQVREHLTSLNGRAARYEPFCVRNSLAVTRRMSVKRLRNVFHLHSVIEGELLPQVSLFDIVAAAFPLLSARPWELLPFYEDAEVGPHRYYGGIVGRAATDASDCFLNLRNALLIDGVMHAKVGVGLIAESTADDELLETQKKISALMEAVFLWKQ